MKDLKDTETWMGRASTSPSTPKGKGNKMKKAKTTLLICTLLFLFIFELATLREISQCKKEPPASSPSTQSSILWLEYYDGGSDGYFQLEDSSTESQPATTTPSIPLFGKSSGKNWEFNFATSLLTSQPSTPQ
jgi:hypothetical protein